MKKLTLLFVFTLCGFLANPAMAQEESTHVKIVELEQQKKEIIAEEKQALKKEVEQINVRLERKEIDWEEAERLKGVAAKKRALNIENRVAIIDNQIALLKREKSENPDNDWDWDEGEENEEYADHDEDWFDRDHYNRTSTHLVIAAGFNNALTEDLAINDSDFKIAGSRFFEIGISWRTRVFQHSNWLRLKYGFSFQFNGLKPTDNRYFVEDEELTVLEEYPVELDKSKFRMDNLVFPLFFELGPSTKLKTNDKVWFSTEDRFRIGLGGYAGVNIGERQKLKFEDDGEDVKRKLKGDYNTNDFVYGLSAYIGFGGTVLYGKYDLNPIFQDPNPELHNVSVGLRFDLN